MRYVMGESRKHQEEISRSLRRRSGREPDRFDERAVTDEDGDRRYFSRFSDEARSTYGNRGDERYDDAPSYGDEGGGDYASRRSRARDNRRESGHDDRDGSRYGRGNQDD